ncbi:MAG: NlpC/P60 family protein [Pseudomonadota bacterium]
MHRGVPIDSCHEPEKGFPLLKRMRGCPTSSPLRGGAFFFLLLVLSACAHKAPAPAPLPRAEIIHVRYTIQVGAFATVANAIRLTHSLENRRLSAYYYRHKSGLFKVRFGDFASHEEALVKARSLVSAGIFQEYYIVSPEEYPGARLRSMDNAILRAYLVETAENYIGIPYQWGGTSPGEGFDCSGLVMAVYQLNGYNLPRCSYDQFAYGVPVDRSDLEKGDLVFFADSRRDRISHVGMYTGNNCFIHAPSKGKTIRKDSLSEPYYAARFAGARTYLR